MFSHYQIIFQRQTLGLIEFEDLVIDSGLEVKVLLKVGCPKTLEFSACSFLRIESQNGEVKIQGYYLGVVMDVGNEQN